MKLNRMWHIPYVILFTLCLSSLSVIGQNKRQRPQTVGKTPTPSQQPLSSRQIVEKVSQSVVLIVTQDADGEPLAQGSGFFYGVPTPPSLANNPYYRMMTEKTNLVATNLHVFKRAWQGYVKTLNDGVTYKIKQVVGIDIKHDICVLEVQGTSALPLVLGHSNQIAVGDDVYVAGNPKGLEGSFSKGIVSSIRQKQGLIQIDAAISSGSSGGPVVNNRGEVIGIAAASLSSGQNLNFAIPVIHLARLPLSWQATVNAAGALAVTDKEEDRLVGPVQSVVIREAEIDNRNNQSIEAEPELQTRETYNEVGAQTRSTVYKADSSILDLTFEYDERGMRSRAIVIMPNREPSEETYTDAENLHLKLKNRSYSVTKKDEYTAKNGSKVTTTTTYDRDGNEIEKLSSSDGTTIRLVTKYDEEGKKVETRRYTNGVLELKLISRYVYKLDGYGNWIKQTEMISLPNKPDVRILLKVIYREITYYQE